jgi:adenine-specific DNA-methyltransferase
LGKVTLIQNIDVIEKPHPWPPRHPGLVLAGGVDRRPSRHPELRSTPRRLGRSLRCRVAEQAFYRELANWYFWALPQVDFPADIEKDDEKRRATGLIRLLTRLIFCWFLKEKELVPDELFAESDLRNILKDLSPNTSTYNEAILQNLFFATLNQRMGKDAKGQLYRAFAKDEGFQKNRTTYGVDTLYRYEDHFRDPDTALEHFADVPFLNGGLFECLDRIEEGTNKKLYLDGFTRNSKKRANIPNHLFFSGEHEEDLSGAYGDTKRRREKVRGLLHILNAYKFTIVENTPVDQEIALGP